MLLQIFLLAGAMCNKKVRPRCCMEKARRIQSGLSCNSSPAVTYSPGGSRPQYHQRWRA